MMVQGGTSIIGNLYVGGTITNLFGNLYVGGNIYMNGVLVGSTQPVYTGDVNFNAGNVYLNNNNPATSTTNGTLLVKGGVGVQGNIFMQGGMFVSGAGISSAGLVSSTSSYTEYMSPVTYASSISVNFITNVVYYVSGTPTPITSLSITSLPPKALASYTFSFMLASPGSSANYITASSITVNGTSVPLLGTVALGTPVGYILQQITVFNTSNTNTPTWAAISTASAY
jgi:hypothetical protein